ncbi:hypothetical protein ACLB2K_004734 [Fragaria x ananassa]
MNGNGSFVSSSSSSLCSCFRQRSFGEGDSSRRRRDWVLRRVSDFRPSHGLSPVWIASSPHPRRPCDFSLSRRGQAIGDNRVWPPCTSAAMMRLVCVAAVLDGDDDGG